MTAFTGCSEDYCWSTKETFVWLVNLICDFIGQSAKIDSKSGKEPEVWRRRLTFSLIQIDSLFVQKGARLNGNCFVSRKHRLVLNFCGRCLVLKREIVASDRWINSESNPTVFSATKPARRGGKFHLSRNVRHYYQSFQHRNKLLLNKVSCCTMKTCDFSRSDHI